MELRNKEGHHKIAIVGTGSLFPGAVNTKAFWLNILAERDFIKDVPESHWLKEDYYDPTNKTGDKVYCKKGAFLDDIAFDPVEFGMPPNLLSATDTVQLLSLIVARDTLADTISYQEGKVDPKKTSVILGVAGGTELIGQMSARIHTPEWVMAMRKQGLPESKINAILQDLDKSYATWTENTFPGLLGNVVSGRIANRFDLKGTNCVLDAACASSLAAVKMAVQELQLGTTDMVVTGGSDALNDIFMYMCFSKTTALSPTEDCRPFSDKGDGTVLGEAVAMMSLKRLEDAERDGDKIYAVIASIGSSSDGKSGSIYAPDSNGQSLAVRRAYAAAGFSPEEIDIVECHGTGTMAGDFAEFSGLKLAYGDTKENQYCALGSVKSMIGHTKSAAGAASLLKIAMALNNKVLPPSIKIDHPNPKLNIDESPFYLNTKARPWIHEVKSGRKAGVSSMGFGGTNFHVAMEEYDNGEISPQKLYQSGRELLLFSGNSNADLKLQLTNLIHAGNDQDVVQLAKSSQEKFNATDQIRLSILGEDLNEIIKWCNYAVNELDRNSPNIEVPNCIYYSNQKPQGKLAYLFSGQGSQYLNMGSSLLMQYDEALEPWDIASSMTLDAHKRLNNVVYPIPVFTAEEETAQKNLLVQTQWAQTAIGILALSHLNLLKKLEVEPSAVGGHSYGEVSALYAAGIIKSEEDLINISWKRGQLMSAAGAGQKGAMSAVFISEKEVQQILTKLKSRIVVANINSPLQTVISGSSSDMDLVEKELDTLDIRYQRLNVSTAFHSSMVSDSAMEFETYLKGINFGKSSVPVYSNTTGKLYPEKSANYAKILSKQLASPVRFEDQVKAMYEEGVRTFLEVGPNRTLGNFVKDILKDLPHNAISLDLGGKMKSKDAFWIALGRLAVAGVPLELGKMWADVDDCKKKVSDRKPSIATVQINGSNYGKPYPPAGGAKNLPKPNPEVVEPATTQVVAHQTRNDRPVNVENTPAKMVNPNPVNSVNSAQSADLNKNIQPKLKMSAVNNEWLQAFQELQQNSLEAQKKFQETLSESHRLFLETSQIAIQQLGAISGVQEQVYASPVAIPSPAPSATVQQIVVPKIVDIQSPIVEIPKADQPEIPVANNHSNTIDFEDEMLIIVSEKTGYPKEIVDLTTDLESGLGIDSIKRVEILSALQEKFPELKSVDKSKLAAMNTLGEILDFSKSISHVDSSAIQNAAPAMAVPVNNGSVSVDFEITMLQIVADKTGYPKEILDLNTDLESGFGIDSIKRVEILSALQEAFPELKNVDKAKLAAINTLGEILSFSKSNAPVQAVQNASISNVVAISNSHTALVDFEEAMLQIVADKTGYPKEILDLNTDLESGFGIDSIKRVEILSALQERFPELKSVDKAKLAAMNTLGEILSFSNGQSALQATVLNGSISSGSDLNLENFEDEMLSIVAEKTGYPKEILDLNTDLESGFGIDSIKRVEILSALQEKFPALKSVDKAKLAAMNTLGEIMSFSNNSQGLNGASVATEGEKKKSSPTSNIFRYIVEKRPILDNGFGLTSWTEADVVYIIKDDRGVGEEIEKLFQGFGSKTKLVDSIPESASYVLNLKALDAHKNGSVNDLLAVNRDSFLTAQVCGKNLFEGKGCLILPFDNGLWSTGKNNRAYSGGISALAKTAKLEWPDADVLSINIDTTKKKAKEIAGELFKAITTGGVGAELEVDSAGKIFNYNSIVENITDQSRSFKDGDTIVVSGGAKGVTAACLIELSTRVKLNIGILGRTKLEEEPAYLNQFTTDAELKNAVFQQSVKEGKKITPMEVNRYVTQILGQREAEMNINTIRKNGSTVRYLSVDISDKTQVMEALKALRAEFGSIQGIIHAAGVLADKYIHEKTVEQFDKVFDTKLNGFINMLEATSKDKLSHICCFSSVAARMGNVGQVDYAMANEVLNKVCQAEQFKRKETCVVKSINWGPWDGGMVSPELKKHFESLGVDLIPLQTGAEIFADEMEDASTDHVEIVVGGSFDLWGTKDGSDQKHVRSMWVHHSNSAFLESHRIEGKVVVPMMMAAEWCMRLAKSLFPKMNIVEVNDVKVYKGIQLLHFDENGDVLRFVYSVIKLNKQSTVDIRIENSNGHLFYGVQVVMEESIKASNGSSTLVNGLKSWPRTKKDIYTKSLFHGPDFQVVEKLEGISEEACAGLLKMNNKTTEAERISDLFLLDGGIQVAILAMEKWTGNKSSLPLGFKSLMLYEQPALANEMKCELILKKKNEMDSEWDIQFKNKDETILAEMNGLRMYMYQAN